VAFLVSNGALLNEKNKYGKTALDLGILLTILKIDYFQSLLIVLTFLSIE
jgi:hypothetical protein